MVAGGFNFIENSNFQFSFENTHRPRSPHFLGTSSNLNSDEILFTPGEENSLGSFGTSYTLFPDLVSLPSTVHSSNQFNFLDDTVPLSNINSSWDFSEIQLGLSSAIDTMNIDIGSNILPYGGASTTLGTEVQQIPQQQQDNYLEPHHQNNDVTSHYFQEHYEYFNNSGFQEEIIFASPLSLNGIDFLEPSTSSHSLVLPEKSKSDSIKPTKFNSPRGSSKNQKKQHLQKQREMNKAKVPCSMMCGKEFGRQQEASRHERTHGDLREFQCLTCHFGFKRKDALLRHMKTFNSQCGRERRRSLQRVQFEKAI